MKRPGKEITAKTRRARSFFFLFASFAPLRFNKWQFF